MGRFNRTDGLNELALSVVLSSNVSSEMKRRIGLFSRSPSLFLTSDRTMPAAPFANDQEIIMQSSQAYWTDLIWADVKPTPRTHELDVEGCLKGLGAARVLQAV